MRPLWLLAQTALACLVILLALLALVPAEGAPSCLSLREARAKWPNTYLSWLKLKDQRCWSPGKRGERRARRYVADRIEDEVVIPRKPQPAPAPAPAPVVITVEIVSPDEYNRLDEAADQPVPFLQWDKRIQ